MQTPAVRINLRNIEENARLIRKRCQARGISVTGVVKGAAGDLKVAETLLRGGITSLGDSRLKNIIAFRQTGFNGEIVLLRLPQLSEVEKVIEYVDISLVSELATVKALSLAAVKAAKKHGIIVMVDVGDLREGILPGELAVFISKIISLPGLELKGIGTNVGCYGGVLPTRDNTELLLKLKKMLESKFAVKLDTISGGNTSTTLLLEDLKLPAGINHLRVGEGILQGTDITNQRLIKELNHDNFTLVAEIIELKDKPSVPQGEIGHDAFGKIPQFPDRGVRRRAILAVGRQDVKIDGLTPLQKGAEILGASSDHLIVDLTDLDGEYQVGDHMEFRLDYGAMLAVMTSPYIEKQYLEAPAD